MIEVASGKRLSASLKLISNLDDDESSCGKSFSGDELSEGELRAV